MPIRYIRHSQAAHVLIVRAGLFTLCSSAFLSLLPFLARHELGLDSTGFGLFLGSFGMGAIVGGIVILPWLRPKASVESLIAGSIALLSIVTFAIGYIQDFIILCIVMVLGGAGYITILSTFYTIGIKIYTEMDWSKGISNLSSCTKRWFGNRKCNMERHGNCFWYSDHTFSSFLSFSSNHYCQETF